MDTESGNEKSNSKAISLVEPIAGTFFALLFLVLFNVFYYDIKFLTRDFDQIRTLYNISLFVSVILNASRIFLRSKGYKAIADLINCVFLVVIAYFLWTIFPFDTSVIGDKTLWDNIFRILIIGPAILVPFATTISVIKSF